MSKPHECAAMVDACIEIQMPFFMTGPVGAGKSQTVKQRADGKKMFFTDVRLAQLDPTDLKGFPNPDAVNNVMKWLPPDFLPPMLIKGRPNTTKGIVFLDEINSAAPATSAVAYQLVLDRKVGNYELPEGWCLGAAGNRAVDRSIVHKMAAALNNRFIHIEYDIDLEDFVQYGMDQKITPLIIAFNRFKTDFLHRFDPQVNPAAFPTPRSWFTVDKIIKGKFAPSIEHALIAGAIGAGTAGEFKAYAQVAKDLPSIAQIKADPKGTPVPTSPGVLHALITSMSMATDNKESFGKFVSYVERMKQEWQVVYIRDCLKRLNEIKFDKVFTAWSIKNADVVI